MQMLRSRTMLSSNRSLVVLVVMLLLGVAGIAVAREVGTAPFGPLAPLYLPAENPAPLAPTVDTSPAPMPTAGSSPLPDVTAAPARASVGPAAPTAAPAATGASSDGAGGPATAAPGRDIHAIAPEPGIPGFNPPPGRE
jgi:hypothetical protein